MSVGEICNREVIVAYQNNSITEIAKIMRQYHVGDVVIVEPTSGSNIPIGMVTDRDLVIEVLAKEVDIDSITAGDVMNSELLSVRESDEPLDVVRLMRRRGVRRAPVVNAKNELVGIFTLDDMIHIMAEEQGDLAGIIDTQQNREQKLRV